jgi:two-component system cell cycle response regulator
VGVIDRGALPGFVSGAGGLVFAILGLAFDSIWLVALAGVAALVAGLYTLRINERLRKTSDKVEEGEAEATRLALESQVMAARAARFEAEAINARLSAARNERSAATSELSIDDLAGMIDDDTGLFNERFFLVTTEKRLSAARRGLRPLTIVLLEVAERVAEGVGHPAEPRIIAGCLMETLREADTACRLDDGRFAMVLEDTPENGAVWTVERVRRRMADQHRDLTMWAGVACYPAHAFDSNQIIEQAQRALTAARDWRQDRIEVATVLDD